MDSRPLVGRGCPLQAWPLEGRWLLAFGWVWGVGVNVCGGVQRGGRHAVGGAGELRGRRQAVLRLGVPPVTWGWR